MATRVPSLDDIAWPKVFFLGDSLTQQGFSSHGCWLSIIADKMFRKCDVLNRGFSGYTTKSDKAILPRILNEKLAKDVVAFVLFLGANDSNKLELNPLQHVPLDEYKQNLIDMVTYVEDIGIGKEKVILIGPPPCDEEAWSTHCVENGKVFAKCDKMAATYSKSCAEAATQCGVDFVELYDSMKETGKWRAMMGDGLHFSKFGSEFVAERLWPVLSSRIDPLPSLFPDFKDVNDDFLKSL